MPLDLDEFPEGDGAPEIKITPEMARLGISREMVDEGADRLLLIGYDINRDDPARLVTEVLIASLAVDPRRIKIGEGGHQHQTIEEKFSLAALSRAAVTTLVGPQGFLYAVDLLVPPGIEVQLYLKTNHLSILFGLAVACLRLILRSILVQARTFFRVQLRALHVKRRFFPHRDDL